VARPAIDRVLHAFERACADVEERRSVHVELRPLRIDDPVPLDPGLACAALAAAERRGVPARATYSGAGHDAAHLARGLAAGLLFVPLAGGESHTPEEGVRIEDVLAVGEVLLDVLESS
jgi:N-carbamoyl-L-amino-acid hydrolase